MDTESKHSVKIRGKTTGSVIANVVSLAGRNVMQIEIGSDENKSIKPIDGENLATAAKIVATIIATGVAIIAPTIRYCIFQILGTPG